MCGLDLLYRLLGAYEWSLPLNQIADDPGLEVLCSLGLVEQRSSGGIVLCDACDQGHTARVAIDPLADKLGWRCPEAGFVPASPEQSNVVRALPSVLVSRIADALSCRRRLDRPLIDETLWRVGNFEIAHNDVTVYLALRLWGIEDARKIEEAIAAEPRLRKGLVLTPYLSGTPALSIERCQIATLADLVSLENGKLIAKQSNAADLAGLQLKFSSGAPPHPIRPEAEALIRKRRRDGKNKTSARAEAREVKALLGNNSPSEGTLRAIIKDVDGDQ
ncbi:MAG: hypothetical protein ACSHXI_19120 [Hoeflea sp.]|uniref:hypothetical protein n=1 Tax=Hoeflea sp. TaxID=1940281 RepID=UPI003EF30C98